MIAVSAREETPQQPQLGKPGASGPPVHRVLLLSKGAADLDTAMKAVQGYELRWRIARFFIP